MAATHYGLGLHGDRVNELDMNYPSNLSNAFKVCQLITHVFDLYLRSWQSTEKVNHKVIV